MTKDPITLTAKATKVLAVLTKDPITLTAKATKVLADCETFLEVAAESVRALPAERKEAVERRDAAKEQYERAYGKPRRKILDISVHQQWQKRLPRVLLDGFGVSEERLL